jgi:predicted ATPase
MPGSGDASQRARLVGHGSRLSALPLRGRERLSELLRRKFGEVELGKSAAVVLRGIAGAGKTRILAEVLDDAVQRHWHSVVAVADPDSSLIPLGPIIDAAASSTPPLLRRTEIESLASSPDMRFWLVQALQDALEQATANHGLVVVVDDLHWYDAASLAVFRTLVPRTADLPILWIFTVRSGEHGGGVMRTLAEISRTAEVLEVGPLRDEAVEDIITDVLGSAPDAAITSVVRRAENIPLLVLELLHGLLEEDLVVVSEDGATLGHGDSRQVRRIHPGTHRAPDPRDADACARRRRARAGILRQRRRRTPQPGSGRTARTPG